MDTEKRTGLVQGVAAYLLWGLIPLYFILFARSNSFEIVAHRAFWSLVLCLGLLAATRRLGELRAVLSEPRLLGYLVLAGILVTTNWLIYVFGVMTGRTLDAALGYFINPLMFTALGVLLFGERLRRLQWVAFGFGTLAVIVMAVGYGQFPWIALCLAVTFSAYGLIKKLAGRSIAPLPGLAAETLAVLPFSAGYLIWLAATGANSVHLPSWYAALAATTGIVTAVPLLLFASSTRHISMVTIGVLQYIGPSVQFLIGWLVFGEPMPAQRWAGFALTWVAVALFSFDALKEHSRIRSKKH